MDKKLPRLSSELRLMQCEMELLNKADGSAQFNQGDTSVLVAIYGPAEVRANREILDKATVEVIFKPKVGLPDCASKLTEKLIKNSCEPVILTAQHPCSAMVMIVQVIQDSGSLLSCAVNGNCMAMLNAAVPMTSLVCAVTCAISESGEIQLDPNSDQEKDAVAVLTFVFESVDMHVISSSTQGKFSQEQYEKSLAACRTAAHLIFNFYRSSFEKRLSKDAKFSELNIGLNAEEMVE